MTSITIIAVIICAAVATRSNVHNEIAIKLEPRMMINAGKKQKMLMLTLPISSDYHQKDGMHSADGHGKSRPDNNTGYPKP